VRRAAEIATPTTTTAAAAAAAAAAARRHRGIHLLAANSSRDTRDKINDRKEYGSREFTLDKICIASPSHLCAARRPFLADSLLFRYLFRFPSLPLSLSLFLSLFSGKYIRARRGEFLP